MDALAILGPGTHDRELELLRSAGLKIIISNDLHAQTADLAVVLGGDGTIHRFLPQLLQAKLRVLLMPWGSGNDLARALDISSPQIAADLARAFVRGQGIAREIDLGIIAEIRSKSFVF